MRVCYLRACLCVCRNGERDNVSMPFLGVHASLARLDEQVEVCEKTGARQRDRQITALMTSKVISCARDVRRLVRARRYGGL